MFQVSRKEPIKDFAAEWPSLSNLIYHWFHVFQIAWIMHFVTQMHLQGFDTESERHVLDAGRGKCFQSMLYVYVKVLTFSTCMYDLPMYMHIELSS